MLFKQPFFGGKVSTATSISNIYLNRNRYRNRYWYWYLNRNNIYKINIYIINIMKMTGKFSHTNFLIRRFFLKKVIVLDDHVAHTYLKIGNTDHPLLLYIN